MDTPANRRKHEIGRGLEKASVVAEGVGKGAEVVHFVHSASHVVEGVSAAANHASTVASSVGAVAGTVGTVAGPIGLAAKVTGLVLHGIGKGMNRR